MRDWEKRDADIREALEDAADFLEGDKGYEVVSVNLYGSQNYDCDTPASDYDFKAIIIPTLNDIILNRNPVSRVVDFGDRGGQIDIKDVRLMFDCYKKQNVNFIETMFTRWYWVNPTYAQEWEAVREMANRIAFADPAKALNCMIGMAKEKQHALCHEYESKKEILAKYGFDPKQLMHIIRLHALMKDYIEELTTKVSPKYGWILIPDENTIDYLMMIKTMSMPVPMDVGAAKAIAAHHIDEMAKLIDKFREEYNELYTVIDVRAYEKFDVIRARILRKSFKRELLKEI